MFSCVCTNHRSTFWNYMQFTPRKLEKTDTRRVLSTFDLSFVESTTRKHGSLNSKQSMTTRSLLYFSAPLDGGYRVCCDGLQYLWLYSFGSRWCCNSSSGRVWKHEIGCKTRVFSKTVWHNPCARELHFSCGKDRSKITHLLWRMK